MPASTGWAPVHVTALSSKTKPSTGVPSGASALRRSIPPLRGGCGADRARLARQEVDDVVVDLALEHDPDGDDVAGVPNGAVLEPYRRAGKVEQRRERLRGRHHVAVAPVEIEHEDVAQLGNRRGDLAPRLGDDGAVDVDQPRRR